MNKNLQGGYYIVSLGGVDLLGERVSLPHIAKLLYEAKKHKFVVLQDIVMDGEEKTAIPVIFTASMAYTTEPDDWDEETDGEFVPEPIYTATIYNVYGKNIAIDAEGVASVTDFTAYPDMDALYGVFVRIINAPTSTTLTDEQVDIIKEGVFVNGDFLGLHNPVLCPGHADGYFIYGTLIGENSIQSYTIFKPYERNLIERKTQNYISWGATWNSLRVIVGGNFTINEKYYPTTYPASKKKHFLMYDGGIDVKWHEGNGLYLHTITFNVSGGTTFVIRIVSDSNTACALDSVSGNFVIAGATCLIPSNMGNAVLTPFDANGFNPDIHLFDSATGAYSTAVTLASVESDVITPIG